MKIEIELTLCHRSRLFIPKILVAFVRAPPSSGWSYARRCPPQAHRSPPQAEGGSASQVGGARRASQDMMRAKVRLQHPLAGPRQRGGSAPPSPPSSKWSFGARRWGFSPPPGHEERTQVRLQHPQAGPPGRGGERGTGGVRARQSAPAGDKGGKGGNARQAWGDARKTRTHTHTASQVQVPPPGRGGEMSRLVQNPRQSPPQTEGEGGKRPKQCGTRAKRALCAHTHTQQAQAPPRQCLDARRQEGGLRKGGTGAHGAL